MKDNILFLTTFLLLFALTSTRVTADTDNKTSTDTAIAKDELVIGKDTDDKINTGGGNDNISGKGGNDYIEAGAGDDYIIGGGGNDIVTDGPGNDYVSLGAGDDTFVYYVDDNKGCTDYALGGDGDDTLIIIFDNIDDMMKNEIIKYYQQHNMVGTDIVQLDKFDISLGVREFEHIVVATAFTF